MLIKPYKNDSLIHYILEFGQNCVHPIKKYTERDI